MRILIVEDQIKTANYISKGLKDQGYIVSVTHDGAEGLFLSLNDPIDLVILDIMLPNLNGLTLLKKLRAHNKQIRVILLSARGDVDDRVTGLELGADDYLSKPFSFSELLARVRALLRRDNNTIMETLQVADLIIDMVKHKVLRGHERIELTAKEFALLVLLAQRQGEVLSRTFIAEAVWDINFHSDTNVIDVAIKRLREKIDHKFTIKLIHTVRGMGYVFENRDN